MLSIWSGPAVDGLKGLDDLRKLAGFTVEGSECDEKLLNFVRKHAHRVLNREIDSELQNRLPYAYLEIEEVRLTRLVSEWLRYETAREEFEVVALEDKRTVEIAGLALDLRIDRMDRLKDGSLLVIDYKTGDVKPKLWEMPRPEDVQLPLYACFAVDGKSDGESAKTKGQGKLGGLVFAKISAKHQVFAGYLKDVETTLFASVKKTDSLRKKPLTSEMLYDWKDEIEKLAHEFVQGDAEVDPREPTKTCERCELKVLCRIRECGELTEETEVDDAGVGDE